MEYGTERCWRLARIIDLKKCRKWLEENIGDTENTDTANGTRSM